MDHYNTKGFNNQLITISYLSLREIRLCISWHAVDVSLTEMYSKANKLLDVLLSFSFENSSKTLIDTFSYGVNEVILSFRKAGFLL